MPSSQLQELHCPIVSRFWLFSMWLRIPLENISYHSKLLPKLLLIRAAILLALSVQEKDLDVCLVKTTINFWLTWIDVIIFYIM